MQLTPKINYQLEMAREIARNRAAGKRPLLVLHACCAPCSSAVLEALSADFKIVLFYYNPNISPEDEYRRRAAEQRRLVAEMGLADVRVVEGAYEPQAFYARVRGHEGDPEGGARCGICFEMRLRAAAECARKLGADYFTTTLSISPLKDAQRLNAIGGAIAGETGVAYLYSDFKKKDGYRRSCALSERYGLYRQDYCGCVFSREARRAQQSQALDAREIAGLCAPGGIDWRLELHEEIDSTNNRAKALAEAGAPQGTVVLAERQSAGRGRFGRDFYSPPHSGAYLSIVLRPRLAPARAVMLTILAAAAVACAMERVAPVEAKIKWVNDVYLNDKKACGILCEAGLDAAGGGMRYVVMGIGVNLGFMSFPESLRERATSLSNAAHAPVSRARFIAALLDEINKRLPLLEQGAFDRVIEESRARSNLLGRQVFVLRGEESYPATALDIEADGALRIELPDGSRQSLGSGEVSLRLC